MERINLSIQVPPLAGSSEEIKKFLLKSTRSRTIQQVFSEIHERYTKDYLDPALHRSFAIKIIRDADDNDLDVTYTLDDIFPPGTPGPYTLRVVQTTIDRESSIPVNSSLRPAGFPPLPPKRKFIPPVPLFHEGEAKKRRLEGDAAAYSHIDPDRAVPTSEGDLPNGIEADSEVTGVDRQDLRTEEHARARSKRYIVDDVP